MSKKNVQFVCDDYLEKRLENWQKANKNTIIKVGDFIKSRFFNGEKSEHMWSIVQSIQDNTYTCKLDNKPVSITELKLGDIVIIERSHISQHLSI